MSDLMDMQTGWRSHAKGPVMRALRSVGRYVSPQTTHILDAALSYLAVGRWIHERGISVPRWFPDRHELWDYASADIRTRKVLYVEFGVFTGHATRYWSNRLEHPQSELHGFDSFEGLPEYWNPWHPAGRFDTGGRIPQIDDPRVRFHKGWVEETLPTWEPPAGYEHLVVNIDLDLYSATRTALTHLESLLVPGSLIYFDEFADRNHELKAFEEYLQRTGQRFEAVGADPIFARVMFRRVE